MKRPTLPGRWIALATLALFLVLLGFAYVRGGDDYSDGVLALTRVGLLNRGMTMYEAVRQLHPVRVEHANGMTYRPKTGPGGRYFMIHALTPERYLVMEYAAPKSGAKSPEETLVRWQLREGAAPREDVTIGRVLEIGRFRLRY